MSASSLNAVTFKSQLSSTIVKENRLPEPRALFQVLMSPFCVHRPENRVEYFKWNIYSRTFDSPFIHIGSQCLNRNVSFTTHWFWLRILFITHAGCSVSNIFASGWRRSAFFEFPSSWISKLLPTSLLIDII